MCAWCGHRPAAVRTLIRCGRYLRIFVAKFSSLRWQLRPLPCFFEFWFALRLVSGLQSVRETNGAGMTSAGCWGMSKVG
jgi:hypothetical protein